jgi:hypothetical protein
MEETRRYSMLTYDVRAEMLTGLVGSAIFNIRAVSGGGRGSTVKPGGEGGLKYWNFEQKQGINRGGPIPPGLYICEYLPNYEHFGRCAILLQTPTSVFLPPEKGKMPRFHNRDGFLIHGRGPLGSDGCIVPMARYNELMDALRDNPLTPLRVINAELKDILNFGK